MPCYTTVRTTITDLVLATESARKLRWKVDPQPQRFGVFTVETRQEVQADLERLGIRVFQEKTADISDNTLDELIQKLLVQCAEVR